MADCIGRMSQLAGAAGLGGVKRAASYDTPSLKVRGKVLYRLKDADPLVIRCPLEEKAVVMGAEPGYCFETDHYRGYDAALVRLDTIDDDRLTLRLQRAWAMQIAGERKLGNKTSPR